jgi:hypothetical protein
MKNFILAALALFYSFSSAQAIEAPLHFLIENGRPGTLERGITEISVLRGQAKDLVQLKNGLAAYQNGIEAKSSSQTHRFEFASDPAQGEPCGHFGCQGIDSFSGYVANERVVLTVKFFEDDGEPYLKYFTETSTYTLKR